MRVSVVIPAYNNERYIARTLHSALAQDYDDFEVVVADHSSKDSTADVIRSFQGDPRLRILEPTPAGGGALRNWVAVSQAARGDLIKLLPGDDVLGQGALRLQAGGFDDGVAMVCSRRQMIDAEDRPFLWPRGLDGSEGRMPGAEAVRRTVRAGGNIFGEPGAVMMRRDLLERGGWWDAADPFLIDVATYVRVLAQGDLVVVPGVLSAFRISASQWSVRLTDDHAAQGASFARRMARRMPEVVSSSDARRGVLGAYRGSLQRRIAYAVLARRMGPSAVSPD